MSRATSLPPALARNIEFIDNADKRPAWMTADGTKIYSWGEKGLYTSVNDGTSWQGPWWSIPTASTGTAIHGVRIAADGQLLVSCFKSQGFYAGLWRVNPADWTAVEVLCPSGQAPLVADPASYPAPAGSTGNRSNYFTSWFGFNCYPDGKVIVNEYGHQANGTNDPGARYAFLSTDNGKAGTWSLVYDLFGGATFGAQNAPLPFGRAGEHIHGACWDPYWQRLWMTAGDQGCHTEYSDDMGATWTLVPGSAPFFGTPGGQPGTTQSVRLIPLPDRVLITTDGPIDGILKIERSNGRSGTLLEEAHGLALPHTSNLRYTGATAYQRSPGHPLLNAFYVGAGGSTAQPGVITASSPDGKRHYDLWTDTFTALNPYGVFSVVGPTANGKVLASIAMDGRSAGQSATAGYTMFRADMPTIL